MLQAVAENLLHYFEDLPDSRVIHGLVFPARRDEMLLDLLDRDQRPVLARSAAELAGFALERGRDDHPVVALSRRVTPGQPWLMNWQADATGTAVRQLATT